MSLASKAKVISGYRRLFRASKVLFEGDGYALKKSHVAIRSEFVKHRDVTDSNKISDHLVMVDEAEDMILHGIVRGKQNPSTGNIEVKLEAEHTKAMEQNPSITPLSSDKKIPNSGENVVVTKSTSLNNIVDSQK